VLELAILGLLKEHPMHGYDLRKRLRSDFGLLSSLSFGSLYPALARLEADGAVHELPADRPGLAGALPSSAAGAFPLTGSIAGERAAFRARLAARRAAATRSTPGTRGRRVYELTERGDQLFRELLETTEVKPEDGRTFALRWAFARHLSASARLRLLERRRSQLAESLQSARRAVESPSRPLDRYERSLAEHSDEVTQHDLAWIDQLIEAERVAASGALVGASSTEPGPPMSSPRPAATDLSNIQREPIAASESATHVKANGRSEP
jgi:DNA-binding PadR family transcriptional regulator